MDQQLDQYIKHELGFTLTEFLQPISSSFPAGESVRNNGVYQSIMDARREDDSTLPMGVWSHELKKADWEQVKKIAAEALITRTKDLQLTVWLLEAEIHKKGFHGIAPAIYLICELCKSYWDSLYPEIIEDDIEYRINPILWANEKLLPALRLISVTEYNGKAYTWNDYELARRYEKIRASGSDNANDQSSITIEEFTSAIASTTAEFLGDIAVNISDALSSIDYLEQTLDKLCGDNAPGMKKIADLLDDIKTMAVSELNKRGIAFSESETDETESDSDPDQDGQGAGDDDGRQGGGPLKNRDDAYRQLKEAADYLIRLDPHSPVPYLVLRAIEWGKLNTAELYNELFVKFQGTLNIFEMLGLDTTNENK